MALTLCFDFDFAIISMSLSRIRCLIDHHLLDWHLDCIRIMHRLTWIYPPRKPSAASAIGLAVFLEFQCFFFIEFDGGESKVCFFCLLFCVDCCIEAGNVGFSSWTWFWEIGWRRTSGLWTSCGSEPSWMF